AADVRSASHCDECRQCIYIQSSHPGLFESVQLVLHGFRQGLFRSVSALLAFADFYAIASLAVTRLDSPAAVQELAIARLVATASKSRCLGTARAAGGASFRSKPCRITGARSGLLGGVAHADTKCADLVGNASSVAGWDRLFLGLT